MLLANLGEQITFWLPSGKDGLVMIISELDMRQLTERWGNLIAQIPRDRLILEPGQTPFLILSGPSGSGKQAIQDHPDFGSFFSHLHVVTTRPPRPGEQERDDKICISLDEFMRWKAEDRFVVDTEIQGNQQGILRREISELPPGRPVYLEANAKLAKVLFGCQNQSELVDGRNWFGIFLYLPSFPHFLERMLRRNEEHRILLADGKPGYIFPDEDIRKRLFSAPKELENALDLHRQSLYRAFVVNEENKVDDTVRAILDLFEK